jgi:hypothetical protein
MRRIPEIVLICAFVAVQWVGCAKDTCVKATCPERHSYFIAPDKTWHPTVSLQPGDRFTVEASGLVYMEPGGGVVYGQHDPEGCNPACVEPCYNGQNPGSLVCRHMCGPGCLTETTWYWALIGRTNGTIFLCGKSLTDTLTAAGVLNLAINIAYPELCSGGFSVDITVDRASP